MGDVTVRLPTILADLVGGRKRVDVRGATIGEALDDLVREIPVLGVHLFDDAGAIRRHILCCHNEVYARGQEGLQRRVAAGDTITLLNSVSGG